MRTRKTKYAFTVAKIPTIFKGMYYICPFFFLVKCHYISNAKPLEELPPIFVCFNPKKCRQSLQLFCRDYLHFLNVLPPPWPSPPLQPTLPAPRCRPSKDCGACMLDATSTTVWIPCFCLQPEWCCFQNFFLHKLFKWQQQISFTGGIFWSVFLIL